MTYQPQPGTVPYRVITWLKLQPKGAEFPSAVIAEELGIIPSHIPASLDVPAKHGAIARRKEGNLILWSLGDGTPLPQPFDLERDEPLNPLPSPKAKPAERPKPKAKDAAVKKPEQRQSTGLNVEVIERLRSAALAHGEVADLLDVLADSFPLLAHGDSSFKGDSADRSYLETVLIAAQFAAYDRGEVAKEGV